MIPEYSHIPQPARSIAVIGPGAMGTLFAARLAMAGTPVFLLDYRLDRALLLNEQDIRVLSHTGEASVHVPVTADPTNLHTAASAVIFVKAYQTEAVAEMLAEHLPPHAIAVSLQNGLGNLETLQVHLGQDRVIAGTTAQGAILEHPGVVRDTGGGPTVLGKPDGQADARLDDLVQALLLAGFTVSITTDVQAAIWSKAILNAAINPVAALTRQRNGRLAEEDASLKLMTAAAREAASIARKHGVKIRPQDWRARLQTICQSTAPNINSMLKDILSARRTEIEAINGAIVRIADQHKLPAPINRSLWYLISTIEQGYDRQVTP